MIVQILFVGKTQGNEDFHGFKMNPDFQITALSIHSAMFTLNFRKAKCARRYNE